MDDLSGRGKNRPIRVITGVPGAAKTLSQLRRIATEPGRYVLAVPTLHLIPEFMTSVTSMAAEAGTCSPVVREIHSGGRWQGTGRALNRSARVSREIHDAASSDFPHAVVVVTHEGMMSADLSQFTGWRMIIDEAPAAVAVGAFRIPASYKAFAAAYELHPIGNSGFSAVRVRADAPSAMAIEADDFLESLVVFHRRAASRAGVVVDIPSWEHAADRHQTVRWFSVWTPAEADAFEEVTICAASYFTSIGYLLAEKLGQQFERITMIPKPVRRGHRVAKIRHFTVSHRGSTTFWATDEGIRCLTHVGRWLAQHASPNQFWAANTDAAKILGAAGMPGDPKPPKLAGSNSLLGRTEISMIYSGKPRPADQILQHHFGITSLQIQRSYEHEDIIQFVMRSALRVPEWAGEVTVNLYSIDQAEMLRAYLLETGIVDEVVLEAVPGLDHVVRGPRKLSEEDQQERRRMQKREAMRQRRASEKAMREKLNRMRRRGRPLASADA